jgi:hypothetical protein
VAKKRKRSITNFRPPALCFEVPSRGSWGGTIKRDGRRLSIAVLFGILLFADNVGSAECKNGQANLEIVTVEDVFLRLQSARTVTLAAFALGPRSAIIRAVEAAADRGTKVSVLLSKAFGMYSNQNAQTAMALSHHGIRVHFAGNARRSTHIKAIIIDGEVYLSDRNWARGSRDQIIVRDSVAGDRILIERSLIGAMRSNDHLWTRKGDALDAEANLIQGRRSRMLRVSTESFGSGTRVFTALIARRGRGDVVRLLVARAEFLRSQSEQRAISALKAAGVEVRLSTSNEKMAIDGDACWFGSANATRGVPNQTDFGMITFERAIAASLSTKFELEWNHAVVI